MKREVIATFSDGNIARVALGRVQEAFSFSRAGLFSPLAPDQNIPASFGDMTAFSLHPYSDALTPSGKQNCIRLVGNDADIRQAADMLCEMGARSVRLNTL